MNQPLKKNWTYYLGLTLFLYSFATFGLAALVPFCVSAGTAVTVATGVIISGEIGFIASAAMLGKPFVEGLKAKIKGWFVRRGELAAPKAISWPRHVVGLILFSLSFVTYYVAMAIPFLGLDKQTELPAIIGVALTGESAFASSLFILGGEFWERLKALFQWPGRNPDVLATGKE
jgi:hypothetical protein